MSSLLVVAPIIFAKRSSRPAKSPPPPNTLFCLVLDVEDEEEVKWRKMSWGSIECDDDDDDEKYCVKGEEEEEEEDEEPNGYC